MSRHLRETLGAWRFGHTPTEDLTNVGRGKEIVLKSLPGKEGLALL